MAKKKTEDLTENTVIEETTPAPGENDNGNSDIDLNELLGSMDGSSEDEGDGILKIGQEGDLYGDKPAFETDSHGFSEQELTDTGIDAEPASVPEPSAEPKKPKRTRKTKVTAESILPNLADTAANGSGDDADEPVAEAPESKPKRRKAPAPTVLTIDARAEVETQASRDDYIWHEIQNARRTRRILTGTLSGVEQLENGKTIVIVDYKDCRVVIPMKEMMLNLQRRPSGTEYGDMMLRQNKILGTMLGAEVDFIVKGIEAKSRSVVASRKEAMLKKRQIFYLNTDAAGMYRIYENRIVQARVIAVAEKVIRIEAFGVECSIMARDLSWDWVGDAHERFSVGDQVLVRILEVQRNGLEDISIRADAKSVTGNTSRENLKKCRVQSKYAGKVTDVHKGVVFVRLNNGVNAIAHSCYDRRMPGKKDDVSFAITHIDEEQGVAVGIITRIIKQNL